MIIGKDRIEVIKNIKRNAESCEFHSKVETDDPILSPEESKQITDSYMENRKTISYKARRCVAVTVARLLTGIINRNTEITGLEKLSENLEGVIITSNHFGPLENTVIRHLTNKMGRKKLNIISQTSNFAMSGIIGFLMNYADTIPISTEPRYLAREFLSVLKEKLVYKKEAILLYPEQEMWFNYKKPRPPKNGAYFYAAKLNIPIISCFVEMVELDSDDTPEFKKVRYILHILDVLYADKTKTAKENTEYLATRDYELKKECYERVYGKSLTYTFSSDDIAGFKGEI